MKNLNSDENVSNSIHFLRKFTYKHWLKRVLEQEIIVIHRILSILFKVLNENWYFSSKIYILEHFRMSVDLKCLFELLKQCWLIYGKRKKWIKMTSMAAVRRAKVIFQLESGFWTHQKNLKFFQVQSPNVSKWANCLKIFEVQEWKKVRIRLLTCVICIPGDSTITMIKKIIQNFASVVFDKT